MMHAVLDGHGYVVTVGEFDEVKPGMVPVPSGGALPFLQRKIRHVNGAFVATDKPALPPKPFMTWDSAKGNWVDARTAEQQWAAVRLERDNRIAATDWTQLPDVPLATKEAWAVYRQALRDVTDQPDPLAIVWPVPPSN